MTLLVCENDTRSKRAEEHRMTIFSEWNSRRMSALRWAGALGLGMAGAAMPQTAIAATNLIAGQFLGSAAAIQAQAVVGPLTLGLGTSSSEGCPCAGTNGKTLRDVVSSLSIGANGSLAQATTNISTAYGLKTTTTATTQQTTTISKLNVLGGLITADAVKAVADVDVTASTLTPGFSGSKLVNLVIAGQKIDPAVAENTAIQVANLGTVTVKFVNQVIYGTQAAGIEVEMLRIQVNQSNSLGLPVGAVIVVGEAFAGYNRVQPGATIGGYAETLAVTANAGSLLQAAAAGGALSDVGGCSGTGGTTLTDTVDNLSAGGLLTLGTATTTAFGGPVGKANVAKTTSTLANLSLLGGLITATSIEADAEESRTGNVSTASTLGSTFGSLVVAGVPVAENVAPNTVISVAGLGTVVLNEQPPASKGHIQVNGLHIVVGSSNSYGLPVGAQIFVSHAEATATAF
jgi:hypothetical protein